MPRASGTSSTPSRARWNGAASVMSLPSRCTVPIEASTRPAATAQSVDFPAPLAPSSATTLPRSSAQVDAVEHLDVAVAGDDAAHRERRRRRLERERSTVGRRRRSRRSAASSVRVVPLVLGDRAAVHRGLGRGDLRARRAFSRFLRSFCWPASARMPSGSCASWMAPRPDRIGTK